MYVCVEFRFEMGAHKLKDVVYVGPFPDALKAQEWCDSYTASNFAEGEACVIREATTNHIFPTDRTPADIHHDAMVSIRTLLHQSGVNQ